VDRCGIAAETLDANFDLLLGIINFIQRQKKFVNPNAKSDGHHRRSRPKPDEAVLAKLEGSHPSSFCFLVKPFVVSLKAELPSAIS